MQSGATISVWINAHDVDRIENQEPSRHYRTQIHRDDSKLSKDLRIPELNEPARRICLTLGIKS